MNLTVTKEGPLAILHLPMARLDSTNASEVKAELLVLCSEAIDVLIIDLTDVTFCDSSGLGALLLAERQLRERDGGIIVVDPNGKVKTLLEIAKLDELIPVCATVVEARTLLED
jgi:anti-sigma B factor antagonist